MAIQPIGINHKAANLAILSYQIDLHTIYTMESANMGKCGCGPFEIHKKKVFTLLRVITKVFYCVTPMPRKWEETLCTVPKENHANAS